MTCCGFNIIDPEHALVWADTEVFLDDQPDRHACKVGINKLAGVVTVGTGCLALVRAAADALGRYSSFDQASLELPVELRRAEQDFDMEIAARAPLGLQAQAMVGRSGRYGRIVGVIFRGRDNFAPALPARSFLAPEIDDSGEIDGEAAVIAAAQRQLYILQRQIPSATGGLLVIAEIGPDGVRCRPAFDFVAGRLLRQVPEILGGRRQVASVGTTTTAKAGASILGSDGDRQLHQPGKRHV
jgi:hypothetical protein